MNTESIVRRSPRRSQDLPPRVASRGSAWLKLFSSITLLAALLATGCDQFTGNSAKDEQADDKDGVAAGELDSDQDGLTDAQEAELGTSPFLPDSDGDGVPDAVELLDLGFNPSANALRFNPRLADVPRIEVRIVSPPRVSLHHSTSESQTRSFDNTRSSTEATGFSTNTTNGSSVRSEISNTVGAEVSGTYGVMSGVTATASYSHTWSDSTETSFSWSSTQSRDNSKTLSESQGYSSGNDVVKSGGRVQVAVNLRNTGHKAFTVQTMALGLRKVDPKTGRYQEIGQLEPVSDRTFQNITSLSPGETVEGLVFGAELSLAKAEFLLGDGAMSVRTLMYELTDQDGRPLDHQFTSINARTAEVTIDAGNRARTHYVATYTVDGEGLPLSDALSDVIGVDYEIGSTLWTHKDRVEPTRTTLLSLDGVRTDSAAGGFWTVQIESDDGRGGAIHTIKPFDEDLDIASIRLLPTTAVRLVYVVDADRDGLGERTETLLGTDPLAFDTDGDGAGDGDELRAGTNPLLGLATARIVGIDAIGQTVRVAVRARRSETGDIEALTVDFGDDTPAHHLAADDNDVVEFTHTYKEFGEFTIVAAPVDSGSNKDVRTSQARIRLEPAMREGWSVEATKHKPTHMVSDKTGLYIRTKRGRRGGVFDLTRVTADGEVAWTKAMGAQGEGEMEWWHGNFDGLALGNDGAAYVTDHHKVFAFDRNGTILWQTDTKALSLAAGPDGMVFVISKPNVRGLYQLARIDRGGDIGWRRQLKYEPKAWMPVQITLAGDQLLLSEHHVISFALASSMDRVRRIDFEGRGDFTYALERRTINRQAASGKGDLILTGNVGGYVHGRPSRMGVWRYDAHGKEVWSDVEPPSSTRSSIMDMAVTPDGRLFVIALFWEGDSYFPRNTERRVMLIGWNVDGQRTVETSLETLAADARAGFHLSADEDGVYIARKDDKGVTVTRRTYNPTPLDILEGPR